jgi:hypothetical protein
MQESAEISGDGRWRHALHHIIQLGAFLLVALVKVRLIVLNLWHFLEVPLIVYLLGHFSNAPICVYLLGHFS